MTTKPFELKLVEGLPKLRAAFVSGRLAAQRSPRMCIYYLPVDPPEGQCGCAIGVQLPPKVAQALAQIVPLDVILASAEGIIAIPSQERETQVRIQTAHDTWCRWSAGGYAKRETEAKAWFVAVLNKVLEEHDLAPVQAGARA